MSNVQGKRGPLILVEKAAANAEWSFLFYNGSKGGVDFLDYRTGEHRHFPSEDNHALVRVNEPDNNPPDHDEEDEIPSTASTPAPHKPHLLDRLHDALSSQRDQLARAQQRAEAEEARLEALARELTSLEDEREREGSH